MNNIDSAKEARNEMMYREVKKLRQMFFHLVGEENYSFNKFEIFLEEYKKNRDHQRTLDKVKSIFYY